ncbi:DUF2141 domain-containing protein [Brunnivagina elsteri]|uniref:DUF2141 domain-containing protein n=1 Tax=Brunnivagina elsteri CCALA 953 TaxID=987040 RepID=A0A2A2TQ68_9CYAN|nr:DUF2141 domain-containing protein [Calothrix elsteri]PAX60557.1 hypothetical protein CK510_01160 [Calothrix elsteri CCALA 953]
MKRKFFWSLVCLTSIAGIGLATIVNAESNPTLTVVVNGVQRSHNGQICMRVFSGNKGFPNSDESGVKSACVPITGNSVTKQFSGLKPGTYAVGIIDDKNGDEKLNTDWLGIPKEGFGMSRNPKVSVTTGTPKFGDASFPVRKNITININMKYSLDS